MHPPIATAASLPTGVTTFGRPRRRPRFETRVIPRTAEIDATAALLGNVLVVIVGGPRLVTSPSQVLYVLSRHY
jgi:hypothetical protein